MAPALRDDPEPEEARAPRGRRRPRPGRLRSACRPGSPSGGQRATAPIAAGVLAGLVLVATPPWHGIAVARFGDSPVFEALRRGATRVLYLTLWPGDSANSSLYLYAITRTRVPAVNGYSPLVARHYVRDVFEPLEPLNVGISGPWRCRRSVGWACRTWSSIGPSSRLRSRRTRRRSRSSASAPLPRSRSSSRRTRSGSSEWPAKALSPRRGGRHRPWGSSTRPSGRVAKRARSSTRPTPLGAASWPPARRGPPGFLAFGPYRPLPAGAYTARFRARGQGLRVDVATDRGQRILAERAVDPGPEWTDVVLPFVVERGRPLEFRVAWDGKHVAAIDWVLAVAADRPDPSGPTRWRRSRTVSGSARTPRPRGAGRVTPIRATANGRDWSAGPPGSFPRAATACPSGYVPTRRAGARWSASRSPNRWATILATRRVPAPEVPSDAYGEATLDFELSRPTVLEFPILYLGDVGVFLDRLTVTPR